MNTLMGYQLSISIPLNRQVPLKQVRPRLNMGLSVSVESFRVNLIFIRVDIT